MNADDPTRPASVLLRSSLIKRLVDKHGFDQFEAFVAVSAVEAGMPTPHTALVAEEAAALYNDMRDRITHQITFQLRTLFGAFERLGPVVADAARAIEGIRIDPDSPAAHPVRERPAWASPRGPFARRRHR